jgi:hypothetical protein
VGIAGPCREESPSINENEKTHHSYDQFLRATTLKIVGYSTSGEKEPKSCEVRDDTQPKAEPNRKPSLNEQCGPSVQFQGNRHIEF